MATNNSTSAAASAQQTPPGAETYTEAEAARMGAFDEDALTLADATEAATDDATRAQEVRHGEH